MMNSENISFHKVIGKEWQIQLLYDLLKNRNHNISHSKLPPFEIHEKFVRDNPYKVWYLVQRDKTFLGSFYIKYDNSIGLNINNFSFKTIEEILNFIKNNFTPSNSTPSEIPPFFYINTSSNNVKMHDILNKLELIPIQTSYKIL